MSTTTNEFLLLVEDNDDHAELTEFYIRNYDESMIVTRLRDGLEAMNYLRDIENESQGLPWLILLDLNLPKFNGHEVLSRIKTTPKLAVIPVVIFSTSAAHKDIELAFASHANSYITKPFEMDSYETIINTLMDYWRMDKHHFLITP